MEFTVIINRSHLKVVHNSIGKDTSQNILQLVYKRQEKPVYYLYK